VCVSVCGSCQEVRVSVCECVSMCLYIGSKDRSGRVKRVCVNFGVNKLLHPDFSVPGFTLRLPFNVYLIAKPAKQWR
jgi:hypothetical protein